MIIKQFFHKIYRPLLMIILINSHLFAEQPPRITIIFVVDQLAYHYFPHLSPYFNYGFKWLLSQGINYTNALHPHGMPSTAVGHAGLNTGTWASTHGIIGNHWYNNDKNVVHSDDDSISSAVFSPTGTYHFGKSAHMVMVDGLSDQFALASSPQAPHYAYGISLKSRAAVLTANKLGKAIWLEDDGQFTSSKAYFDQLPEWLTIINKKLAEQASTKLFWNPVYPLSHPAYHSVDKRGYAWSEYKNALINKTFNFDDRTQKKGKKDFQQFMLLPHANQLLLDLSKIVLHQHDPTDHLLLWVCLSSLDKIGHAYGPQSYETVDMLYHLDKQIGAFMHDVTNCYGKENILFVLTADHGISPIVELVKSEGYKPARRINAHDIMKKLNQKINTRFNIHHLIYGYKTPQFYIDEKKLKNIKTKERDALVQFIKRFLMRQHGIKQVWSFDELRNKYYEQHALENYFKQQLYPGRSGQFIVQTFPYVQLTPWPRGTNHQTPYWYDVHVPLIVYKPGMLEKKTVTQKVFTLQLANTLADILQVQRPSASTFDPLPGIDYSQFTKISSPTTQAEQ